MTEMIGDHSLGARPDRSEATLVVVPRIHDGSGARTRYGLMPGTALSSGKKALVFPAGAVDDPNELRAGAALLLARQIGEGMNAAVIAPLGQLFTDEKQRLDVMLAVARQSCPEAESMLADGPVQWLNEQELLQAVSTGKIVDTTTAAAITLLLSCGELLR